jgi:uncharacterized protein YbjT (DUF2867 family)
MSDRKIIAVVGATGAQGGGLVRAILADTTGEYAARALTRKPDSEKARALAQAGAQVVMADIDDEASTTKAFEGAYGAFCLTNFWEHFSPERELAQAGVMARAAKAAGVKHVVWSTLEDTRRHMPLSDPRMPVLMDKYNVPHFDAKGEADALFAEAGVPTTWLLPSVYWDNFIHFGMGPRRGADGVLALNMPIGDRKFPAMAVEDIGRCAFGVFKRSDLIGKTVGIAGEHLTGAQMAAAMSKALGQEVRYNAVPFDVYRGLGFPGAEDLGNMFHFNHDFADEFCRVRDLAFSRSLNPKLQTFEAWLSANKDRIPLE